MASACAEGYVVCLMLGIDVLGREVAAEVEPTLVSIRITLAPYRRVVGRAMPQVMTGSISRPGTGMWIRKLDSIDPADSA